MIDALQLTSHLISMHTGLENPHLTMLSSLYITSLSVCFFFFFCCVELYEHAIKYEKGSFITSSGALATLSGAKTGRSPRDKRVVKDETTDDLWWGK